MTPPEEINVEREVLLRRRGRHYAFPVLGKLPGGEYVLLFHDAPAQDPESLFDPESTLAFVTGPDTAGFSADVARPVPRFSSSGYAPSIVPLPDNHFLITDNSWHVYNWLGEPCARIIETHEWVILLRGAHTIEVDANGGNLKFGKPRRISSLDYPVVAACGPPIIESGNTILCAVDYNNEAHQVEDRPWETVFMKSEDLGKTWSMAGKIYFDPDLPDLPKLHKPCAVKTGDGEIICAVESFSPLPEVFISRSADDGATWSAPAPTGIKGNSHRLTRLADGRLMLSTTPIVTPGADTPTDSIDLFFTSDSGASWKERKRIILEREKKSPAGCASPRPIQLPDGSIRFTFHSTATKDTRALCACRITL